MRDSPADDSRSGDRDDAPSADGDSKAGTAQHSWEEFGDVGVADAPKPAEGGDGDSSEDQISGLGVRGRGQDGGDALDERGEDRRGPSAYPVSQRGPEVYEHSLQQEEHQGVADRVDRRVVELFYNVGCQK